MDTITGKRIRVWWDDSHSNDAGWYAVREAHDSKGWYTEDDSLKIWWLINVDEFSRDSRRSLVSAIEAAYPEYEVILD